MTFVFLIAAIISEVTATLSLRMASQDGSDKRCSRLSPWGISPLSPS